MLADCGCRIIASYNNDIGYTDNDTGFPDNVIDYCPLHAAVEQMRDALTDARRLIHATLCQEEADCYDQCISARAALAAAEALI